MALNPALAKLVAQAKNKYSGGGGKTAKLKDGRNTIRIICKMFNGDERFWRDLGVHWIKASPDGKPLVVTGCASTVYDQPSVIATAIDQAIANAHDEDSKKLYEEWRARRTVLVNVINRQENDEVQVLELTTSTFGKILNVVELYAQEGQDILDNELGLDFVVTKTGAGLNTKYDVQIAPQIPGRPHKPVTKDQMDRAVNLDDFIASNYFRGEEQKALNAIAQIAGIAVPTIGAIGRAATPTAALNSPAAAVAGASVAASAPAAAVDPVEERRRQLQAEMDALQRQSAAPAAPAAPAAATSSDLSMADQEALLAELDNLGNL